jgi:hypothetical protein
VSNPASPAAAANGQYLLIRRALYERVGGHRAIRDQLLEDVELAKRAKQAGGKLLFLPGAAWIQTRMYRTFPEMWRGWTKNLYLIYGGSLAKIGKTLAELATLDLLPQIGFIAAILWLLSGRGNGFVLGLALGSMLVLWVRQAAYLRAVKRLGFDSRVAPWRLEGVVILGALLVNSVIAHRVSHRVEWKGRRYSTGG